MIAVSDSSPLIILSKLGCFDLLRRLFPRVCISSEVHYEIVIAGAGLPGASEVSNAEWIEVQGLQSSAELVLSQQRFGLGPGEMSTILLGQQLGANVLLIDDRRARRLARTKGFELLGSVGLLEAFYIRGYLTDLRGVFQQLSAQNVYVDKSLLDLRLRALGLVPL